MPNCDLCDDEDAYNYCAECSYHFCNLVSLHFCALLDMPSALLQMPSSPLPIAPLSAKLHAEAFSAAGSAARLCTRTRPA